MHPLRRLPLLAAFAVGAMFLAGCDGTSSPDDEQPLAAFSPSALAVVRIDEDAGPLAAAFVEGGDSLFARLRRATAAAGIASSQVGAVYAAPGAGGTFDAVVEARFDAATAGARLEAAGFTRAAGAVAVYRAPAASGIGALAFVDGRAFLSATAASVEAMLDRRAGRAASLGDDAVAVRLVARLLDRPVGAVTAGPDALAGTFADSLLGDAGALLAVLPIARTAVALDEPQTGSTRTGTLWLAPRAGTSAATLASTLSATVALARLQPGLDPATVAFLAALAFTPDGPDVRTTFRVNTGNF